MQFYVKIVNSASKRIFLTYCYVNLLLKIFPSLAETGDKLRVFKYFKRLSSWINWVQKFELLIGVTVWSSYRGTNGHYAVTYWKQHLWVPTLVVIRTTVTEGKYKCREQYWNEEQNRGKMNRAELTWSIEHFWQSKWLFSSIFFVKDFQRVLTVLQSITGKERVTEIKGRSVRAIGQHFIRPTNQEN